MTTTSKAPIGKQSPSIGDGWDDAQQAAGGGSDTPAWCPHWGENGAYKEKAVKEKMTTAPEGSIVDTVLIGKLVIAEAFGEPRYFVDREKDGIRFALPNHGVLTSTLDHYEMTPTPIVRLAFMGEAARARPGERAAFVYDVRSKNAMLLKEPREGALFPQHKTNKEKRDAANKGRGGKKAADETSA